MQCIYLQMTVYYHAELTDFILESFCNLMFQL